MTDALTDAQIGARSLFVQYECASCHHVWDSEEPPEACPNCHREAGLEKVKTTLPFPMAFFGGTLAFAAALALVGTFIALSGGEATDRPHWQPNILKE